MTFTIPGAPQGKARPRFSTRNGQAHTYTLDSTKTYEQTVAWEYRRQCNRFYPQGTALSITVNAVFEPPASASKAKRAAMLSGELHPTKKPDADNILKIIADSLNGVAYHDDAQLIHAIVHKRYGDTACVMVEMEEI